MDVQVGFGQGQQISHGRTVWGRRLGRPAIIRVDRGGRRDHDAAGGRRDDRCPADRPAACWECVTALLNRIHRVEDGQRIEGVVRPVFIHNFSYHLTNLLVFADGAINCWEWVDLDGLRQKLECGWVVTEVPEGGEISAFELGRWKASEPSFGLTPEMLLGEVADDIERLNDRPDSTGRCLAVLDRYLESRDEADRLALREAYLAIPEHKRHYSLGDMDNKDRPLVILCTDVGEPPIGGWFRDENVTEAMREWALQYFADRDRAHAEYESRRPADDPPEPAAGTIHFGGRVYPKGWPEDAGIDVLQNEYPSAIEVGGVVYPSVTHAYWALSTADPEARERIRAAERPYEARKTAEETPRVENWSQVRTAVMAALLRAKYAQHPDLAEVLLGTGDAPIGYSGVDSDHWITRGGKGRNWVGRLLELVRSELQAQKAGIPFA
ncbi:NADAR family protein [Actinomadura darangshiensis]|uniref:NADAR family protein n=1 Tax=Actinomadura darangshiensis TaxID=705336 RepID=A0A4R5AAK4_9ACTN|nr:NADAR family protein [Actinomadura darangshiensis]TDD68250.1 NADAR family protein [Actinomadura darangshiensis]